MIKISKVALGILGLFLLAISLVSIPALPHAEEKQTPTPTPAPTPMATLEVAREPAIDNLPLRDNPEVYKFDDPSSIVTVYVTVRKGDAAENADYTWQQVNSFNKAWYLTGKVVTVGKAEAIVQFGDETGPLPGEFGYDAEMPNAMISVRGSSSSLAEQKSYKIEFFDDAGTWRGQSTLDLNKHPYDPTRLKNKLSFDLLKEVPDLTSLRTQFVHLYVKDETTTPVQTKFIDYGLFTQIEQPNQKFLKSRLLDSDGQLYKATNFEFYRYPDQIRLVTDPLYNADDFSLRLEIKGNDDNNKLIQMLDDVNNMDIPIEQIFEKYFNADNYFTWMAFNILVGNLDTNSQNFFLYSPVNSEKWYFLPWDYDGAFPLQDHPELRGHYITSWENGISNYWGVVLHRRVLTDEIYRQELNKKVEELLRILTPDRIQSLIDVYSPVVDKYISAMPDLRYLPRNLSQSRAIISLLPDDVNTNYKMYVESLNKPMPFYLGTPQLKSDGTLNFNWDESYNFKPQDITYHFKIGRDIDFKSVVFDTQLINQTKISIPTLKSGAYFWTVIATNEDGQSQTAFDSYAGKNNYLYSGVKHFTVAPDGSITED